MPTQKSRTDSIVPRKQPFQTRSKKRVADILNATVTLLEKQGAQTITTHHIAEQAGICVASMYQYFPNKKAIICAVFKQWLDWVKDRIDAVEEKYYLSIPCDAFFDCLMSEILDKTLFSYAAENQLSQAMRLFPELIELDRQHGDTIAKRLAMYLQGYGSQWPVSRLEKLGHLLYQMCSLLYNQFGNEEIIKRKHLLEWSRIMAHSLLKECLGKKTGTSPSQPGLL